MAPTVPLEYVVAIVVGVVAVIAIIIGLIAWFTQASRRKAEQRYGEPPTWMVKRWKAMHAERTRRIEANAALVDLVAEHNETEGVDATE